MAATYTLNSYSYDGRYLQVALTQTKDAANRRSKVTGTVTSLGGNSTWYATGPTTVSVGGTQRYSRARESSGTGQSNKNFVGTIAEFYVSHDTAGNASVAVGITTAIYASATQSTSGTWTLDSIGAATTACGTPTACSVNTTVAEGNVTLSWSGAANGTNNAISSYEIQYSESTNNSTWGSWTALTTVTTTATSSSVSVAPPSTRGSYRRFQIRTRGAAGSTYYSGWKISSNSVRRNTAPTAPTTVTASPSTYSNEAITLSWSGASGGTSAIKSFQIASRTSTDNATWSSWNVLTTLTLAASSGSYTPTVSSTPGTYTQFGVWTIDALSVYSGEKASNSIYCNITACSAPTVCSLSATLAEGNVTLSWSGAASGAGNAINSYEIQYSDSSNNQTWGSWTALQVVQSQSASGTLSVSPSSTRGNYRRFQIRTRGAAGESFYSTWKISSNSVRKNINPTYPTSFVASPDVYMTDPVTLTWNGTTLGTSAIKEYVIRESVSTDKGATWSTYQVVATIASTETFGSYLITPPNVDGIYVKYSIGVTDVLGGTTAYRVSNTIYRNTKPKIPTVDAPKIGSKTYNNRPICLIQTQPEPDGQPQTIWVRADGGDWYNSADNPDHFTTQGSTADGIKTVCFFPSELEEGAHSLVIQIRDEYASGTAVERVFSVIPAPFEEILANETHVKARHILDLRTAANTVRNYYNLPAFVWAHEIVPGRTEVRDWPFHIIELRAAIQGVIDKINTFDETAQEIRVAPISWIDIGLGRPRADVMEQLAGLIKQL